MAEDPYSKWLGLPPGPRPPKAHELLGLPAKPTDSASIDAAAGRRMDQLDQYTLAKDRATRTQVQQLMNEVAQARTKLVGKLPKRKPEADLSASSNPSSPSPSSKLSTSAPTQPTQPTPPPVKQDAPPPADQLTPQRASTTPTNSTEASLESLPYVGPSRVSDKTKSAIVFWSLITTTWAASLAAVFAITYTIAAPQAPEPTREVVLAGTDLSDDDAASGLDTEPPGPASEVEVLEPKPETEPEPEPVGPTAEELAAQQAERQRLALEQQQAERERLERERKQAEALKALEAARLAAEQRAKEAERGTYFERRDRLTGREQIALIREELSIRNGGIRVNVSPEFEGDQLIGLDLRSMPDVVRRGEGAMLVTDLSPLRGLKLRKLNLENFASLETLDGLKGMPLEWLYMRRCESLEDLSALKGMPIQWLVMSDVKIKDVEALRGMPLKHFVCDSARSLTSTTPLKGIAFETISLSNCVALKDIDGLDGINAEKGQANLNGTAISDLSPLAGKQIDILSLRNCDSIKTLDGLKGAKIGELDLRYMDNLEDISDLPKILVSDKFLLSSPKVKSLSYLSNLRAKTVIVDCVNVKNLRGLESLRNVELLDIQHMTQISRKEVDRIKNRYEKLMVFSPYGVLR